MFNLYKRTLLTFHFSRSFTVIGSNYIILIRDLFLLECVFSSRNKSLNYRKTCKITELEHGVLQTNLFVYTFTFKLLIVFSEKNASLIPSEN